MSTPRLSRAAVADWVIRGIVGCAAVLAGCGSQTLSATGVSTTCAVAAQGANTSTLEGQVLVLINQVRAQGANCGAEGTFTAQPALQASALLGCVARAQSAAMATQNFFSHTNPDGSTPGDRLTAAGYAWSAMGENIAAGLATAEAVMRQWMQSDGHCANIMSPNFSQAGVGYYQVQGSTYDYYWTQEFAHPAQP